MSIQFRSRVKSVQNFGNDLKQVGTCCYADGTSEASSFYECFTKNGTFIASENAKCPTSGEIGICFACSYLTASEKQSVIANPNILIQNTTLGRKNVTNCECNRIGGKFFTENTTTFGSLNDSNGRDIRLPKACCYFGYTAEYLPYDIICEDVCTEKECSLKGVTLENGNLPHTPVYTADKLCSEVSCSSSDMDANIFAKMAVGSEYFAPFDIGTCYTLTKNTSGFSYSCDLSMLHDCSGYWVTPDKSETGIILCDGNIHTPKTPSVVDGRAIEPTIYTQQEFNELGLSLGDEFQGGIYIGTYEIDSSILYGSLNFSAPLQYRSVDNNLRDSYKKFALIVDKTTYYTQIFTNTEMESNYNPTSFIDGFFTCYGNRTDYFGLNLNTINSIKGIVRNGFADYYIPSLQELNFLAYQIQNNSTIRNAIKVNGYLASSTIFFENLSSLNTNRQKFNNQLFIYGQELNQTRSQFGKNILLRANNNLYFRLFRKVIIQ